MPTRKQRLPGCFERYAFKTSYHFSEFFLLSPSLPGPATRDIVICIGAPRRRHNPENSLFPFVKRIRASCCVLYTHLI